VGVDTGTGLFGMEYLKHIHSYWKAAVAAVEEKEAENPLLMRRWNSYSKEVAVVEAVAVVVVGCKGSKEEEDDVDSNGLAFFLNSMKSPLMELEQD
jgi:hypothetical protein